MKKLFMVFVAFFAITLTAQAEEANPIQNYAIEIAKIERNIDEEMANRRREQAMLRQTEHRREVEKLKARNTAKN